MRRLYLYLYVHRFDPCTATLYDPNVREDRAQNALARRIKRGVMDLGTLRSTAATSFNPLRKRGARCRPFVAC
jgi:hypothetical protein